MKKKTMMSKAGILAAAFMLSVSMLAGCGNDSGRSSDEVTTEAAADSAGMVHLESAEEVSAFMEEVYGGVAEDLLPSNITTTELDLNDEDLIEYQTGLVNLNGIEGVYLSESMMTSTPYSAIYIRTNEEADAEAIRQQIMDSVDPSKWICVTAEKQYAVILGKDIFFVMGYQETADAVLEKAMEAAKAREMKVSDTLDKTNPI